MKEKGVSHIAYFRLDGGSSKLYTQEYVDEKDKKIERLHSIIKEVREYIEKSKSKLPLGINDFTCEMVYSDEVVLANELLGILDKENNNESNRFIK